MNLLLIKRYPKNSVLSYIRIVVEVCFLAQRLQSFWASSFQEVLLEEIQL